MKYDICLPRPAALLVLALLLLISGLFSKCSQTPPSPEQTTTFIVERQQLLESLSQLQDEIDLMMSRSEKVLVSAGSDNKSDQLIRTQRILVRKKTETDQLISTVTNSTVERWPGIKRNVRYAINDIKRVCLKVERNELSRR